MKKCFLVALTLTLPLFASDTYQPSQITNWPRSTNVTGTISVSNSTLSYFKNVSLSTTPIHVSVASCDVWGWYFYNNAVAGSERSVKLFNMVAAPTVGVTPSDLTITVGGRSSSQMAFHEKLTFQNGLWILATTASGDSASGAPGNGEVSTMIFYR